MSIALPKLPPFAKPVLAVSATIACLTVLFFQVADLPAKDIFSAVADVPLSHVLLALAATTCSFLAVGAYDVHWHRVLGTQVDKRSARVSGMAAIAIGQTIGFGAITGAFVRWHLLTPIPLKTTATMTLAVSLSFLGCWSLIALPAAAFIGVVPAPLACIIGAMGLCGVFGILRYKKLIHVLKSLPHLMMLTACDLFFAGIALWILIPEVDVSFLPAVLAAYAVALGIGLISNAPGGVGAFELTLVLALGHIPAAHLFAGIILFRLVYYVVPAVLAGGLLILKQTRTTPALPDTNSAPISDLCHQGAILMRGLSDSWVMQRHWLGSVIVAAQTLPKSVHMPGLFKAYYKCGPRPAALARRNGWIVRHIADDAIIKPQSWSMTGAKRRSLRRKIRQADGQGISVQLNADTPPLDAMHAVAAQWACAHSGELGYAMGRYCRKYVTKQRIYLIKHNDRLCGFVTVQARRTEWAIDLIRHCPDMPTGAMHSAFCAIIADAGHQDVQLLSLGAIPNGPVHCPLQKRINTQKAGLRQFKSSFGPHWIRCYHAAPNRIHWIVSIAAIGLRIQRPFARLPFRFQRFHKKFINIPQIIHLNGSHLRVTDAQGPSISKANLHARRSLKTAH